jgi:hypothetical protein
MSISYVLFNYNNIHIHSKSWNYRGCWPTNQSTKTLPVFTSTNISAYVIYPQSTYETALID